MNDLAQLGSLLAQLDRRKEIYKLEYYQPYPYQLKFHHAVGHRTQFLAAQRALMAANQVGKTFCACMEDAYHLTGRYPDWWKGHKFPYPVEMLVSGLTNESVRDILQKELFGDPTDDKKLGTGTVPIDAIGKVSRKAGVPNAFDSVLVKHKSGKNSRVNLRAYEQGWRKFMGIKFDVGHCDEEPPIEIWSQMLRATLSRTRSILYMTFTPEEGVTQVVDQFMNNLKPGQALINATWDDAAHMTTELKQQRLDALPKHEREMRSKGVPMMGSGLVFPFPDEDLVIDDFEIPRHWPQIAGVDYGWDHPFAACKLAWNRESDTVYVVADYRESKATPPIHASVLRGWGDWVPVAWPHDGLNTEKGTGEQLVNAYKKAGVNLLPWKATNPPPPGKQEGEGGNSVEAAILDMYERMETKRFKVFKSCRLWAEEKRQYHRKDGKLVKLFDDVISASRYAHMMLRHARTMSVRPVQQSIRVGARNWS